MNTKVEHTLQLALSVVTAGCTINPLSGMKPANDLSSHRGTAVPVVNVTTGTNAGDYPNITS